MKRITNITILCGFLLIFFSTNVPCAKAIVNSSMDLEKGVISVFSKGEVVIKPDGANIFFRSTTAAFSTTQEAFSDCKTKVENSISILRSLGSVVETIEKTPIKFHFKKKGHYGMSSMASDSSKISIDCVAVQDIRITLTNKAETTKKINEQIILIEDKMLENKMLPINPDEFGAKGFAFLETWFGEKNNIEWFIKDKELVKKQALKIAMSKAMAKAKEIAQNFNKTIKEVHSIQYIDEKEKILHIWNSLTPYSLKETVELHNKIRYQLGIIVNFSFE